MFLNFETDAPVRKPDPPTRAPVALGVGISLYLVAVVFVSAQILVKSKLGKLGTEDVLISIAAALLLSMLICTCILCKYGFGMHLADINPSDFLTFGKFTYTLTILATACFAFTKLALISFYLRFATSPRFRRVCLCAMAYMALSQTATLLVNLFGCAPVSGAWDRRPEHPSVCVTTTAFYVYASASNIWTDILLLLLPIPILVRLRLRWRVKVGLVGMFSMGFVVTIVSGVSLWKMLAAITGNGDMTWDGAYSWMCTLLELDIGIMTTCMPGMKLFVTWMRGSGGGGGGLAPVEDDTIGGGGMRKPRRGAWDSVGRTVDDERDGCGGESADGGSRDGEKGGGAEGGAYAV